MLDFLVISTRSTKRGVIEVYPKFRVYPVSTDLMIRGGDFYAVWVEERKLWSTNELDVLQMIDSALSQYAAENKNKFDSQLKICYMWDSESGMIDNWHKFCQKQMRDSFKPLDENLIFSNTEVTKKDYASKRLEYPLESGDHSSFDKIISTLYSKEERHKLEWIIGSIVSGDSKKLQKFVVLYGAAGTGKSTILNIIQQLFQGYYSVFDAKALGSSSNSFALESFKTNPLVAIQHDGDLSRIEDNTRLNSLVSHEMMTVNEKFKSTYSNQFISMLLMGTNKPVKITDAKSGLIRRLIDVSPSGKKLPPSEYKQCMNQIKFELGAIAQNCLEVYKEDPDYYNDYIPVAMMGASNDFYNFVIDSYSVFLNDDSTTLKAAWEMYKTYCEEAKVPYPFSKRIFKEELKNYFWNWAERFTDSDGTRIRSYYSGFRTDKFEENEVEDSPDEDLGFLTMSEGSESIFDKAMGNNPAQYASEEGTPLKKWDDVDTKLKDLSTSKLHYVRVPEDHIVIDFDIRDESGTKSFKRNIEEARKWPPTYAEVSKSGGGIHLHYIYTEDVTKLSRVYADDIEVKVYSGKSSLRRKLTKHNDVPIASINSGLPLKGDGTLLNFTNVKSERSLRSLLKRNLNKEIHPGTKPSVDFIKKILDDAYEDGLHYDVSDMKNEIMAFAANSTNQAKYCLKLVYEMKFKSEEPSEPVVDNEQQLIFYDVEVFPNLFLVNWKVKGKGKPVVRMINPSAKEIEDLLKYNLIGFNCRRYDNHILYARLMGYNNLALFNLSKAIVGGDRNALFSEAYNLSYTDVYDFASAGNKKSLKKLEIEMGFEHKELGLPWDQPVPEEDWVKVAEYCDNDVLATEAAFEYLDADWTARLILSDLAEMTPNDTTNTLTTRIIFGKNRNPQDQFKYRDLAKPVKLLAPDMKEFLNKSAPDMMKSLHGEANSLLPYFPGYTFDMGVSTYRDEEVGEGGYVYGEPGMYSNVAVLDVRSMHPHSAIAEVIFGAKYTGRFKDIVDGRVTIKTEDWDMIDNVLDGKIRPYIKLVEEGKITSKQLSNALKTAINSVYGLTSARFMNAFKDPRNKDNIVAKRGALFMIDLKHEVQDRGFTVAHIKTDSIKIPNATKEIVDFVMQFGLRYGYIFEHEATYEKMCLVNEAVLISKYQTVDKCKELYGYIPGDNKKKEGQWSAVGKQFAVPYVFKKLFSKEPITFEDTCETFAVQKGDLYLDMNENLVDVTMLQAEYDKIQRKKKSLLKKAEKEQEPNAKSELELEHHRFCEDSKDRELYLLEEIKKGHDYHFVGRVGQFTPIKKGHNGGILNRINEGKKYAASGSTGFRWLESSLVKELGKEDQIDHQFYIKLVDDAVESISNYGDFEWFAS